MLTNEQIDFLKELVETPMPSGSEEAGALLLGRRIREWTGIQPTIDVHGNLHAVLDTGAKRTVLLEGHLDEIGYQVAYVDASGFVYFQAIGGIVAPLAAAERLVILTLQKHDIGIANLLSGISDVLVVLINVQSSQHGQHG